MEIVKKWKFFVTQMVVDTNVASTAPTYPLANGGSIWQETTHTRKHEALIWQFQSIPKEKLAVKGNIVICVDSSFVIGRRYIN